ncbi:MAG: protein kinase [Planctomycetota bacterium]
MSSPIDPDLEELVTEALMRADEGEDVSLAEICRNRPDLLAKVASALNRTDELQGLQQAAHDHDPMQGRILGGRYRIDERLGAGAMGVVYRATDQELQRKVAVKILRAELVDGREAAARFEREAEALAAVEHPTVVSIYDRGRSQDELSFLVMELLKGCSLSDLLAEAHERSERDPSRIDETQWLHAYLDSSFVLDSSLLRQCVSWLATLTDGLQAAHDAGVFHRDIKPSNIFIRSNGQPVLLDFGIAARSSEVTIAERDTPIGTPAYLDPETLSGTSTGVGVDVYGLTSTLYHMVTLQPPYRGTSHEVLAQLQRRDPPPASTVRPGLPRDLQAVIDCGMNRRTKERYPDVLSLAADLRALLSYQQVRARPIGIATRTIRSLRRSREARAVGAVAVALIAVGAAVWIRNWVQERAEAQWQSLWAQMPPSLLDAPARMRRIDDDEARNAVAKRLDELVALDVEPLATRLHRGLFRYDSGDVGGAADDLRAMAALADTDYARAIAASFAKATGDGAKLTLPPLPDTPTGIDRYLVAIHTARAGAKAPKELAALLDYPEAPRTAQELRARYLAFALIRADTSEWSTYSDALMDSVLRYETKYGRTATTGCSIGVAYSERSRDEEWVQIMRESVALAPECHACQINLGHALGNIATDPSEIFACYRRAIELRPNSFGARRSLLINLARMERFEQAKELVDETLAAEGVATPAEDCELEGRYEHRLALQKRRDGDIPGSVAHAKRAVELFGKGAELGSNRCEYSLRQARRYADAFPDVWLEDLRDAARNPTDWRRLLLVEDNFPGELNPERLRELKTFLRQLRLKIAPYSDDYK